MRQVKENIEDKNYILYMVSSGYKFESKNACYLSLILFSQEKWNKIFKMKYHNDQIKFVWQVLKDSNVFQCHYAQF